jgi:hypothetical protein
MKYPYSEKTKTKTKQIIIEQKKHVRSSREDIIVKNILAQPTSMNF